MLIMNALYRHMRCCVTYKYCCYTYLAVNLATSCSALLAVENGKVTYPSGTTEPYDYGTIATYQCDSGYELTGGDTVRTCTGDGSSTMGQWNGAAPVCTGKANNLYVHSCL